MRKSVVSNASTTLMSAVVQVKTADRLEGRPVSNIFNAESRGCNVTEFLESPEYEFSWSSKSGPL